MTPERFGELRTLCNAATSGPWVANGTTKVSAGCRCLSCYERVYGEWVVENAKDEIAEGDARFIAAARTAVPELLDELENMYAALTMRDMEIGEARHRIEILESNNNWLALNNAAVRQRIVSADEETVRVPLEKWQEMVLALEWYANESEDYAGEDTRIAMGDRARKALAGEP